MGFTTKLLLNTARIKKDGTYPLILRIIYERKVIKIPMGYCFKISEWDTKNQQVKTSSKVSLNITRLNNVIKKQVSTYYDQIADLELSGKLKSLTPKELKTTILGSKKNRDCKNVIDFIDTLIAEKLQMGKKGSAISYRGTKRKLIHVFGESLISFEQIDYQVLKKIEVSHLSEGGSYGGLGVYMRTLRAIYNRAIKEKLVSADLYPFKDYRIKTADTKRRALSETDFERFKGSNLQFSLIQGKDYFLASFYMRGMNFIDMAHLKVGNLQGDFERIHYQRNKTRKFFSIKISEPLKLILKKYIEDPNEKSTYIFPILKEGMNPERQYETITNKRKRLNQKLHKIAESLEIERFTIYAARHTYATMGKRRGVPTAVIQESLGHQTETITQTYLNSFENTVIDEYDSLIMGK